MSDVIDRGRRIELFLADDAIQDALRWMKEDYYRLFLKAGTDTERLMAQCSAQVVETFENAMRALVSAKERETTEQERADRRSPAAPL